MDVIAAGAEAVQLCSVLDYRKILVVDILRRQLRHLVDASGAVDLEDFKGKIRAKSNEQWLKTAKKARALETHHDRVTERIASNKKSVLESFAKTIESETLENRPDMILTQDSTSLPVWSKNRKPLKEWCCLSPVFGVQNSIMAVSVP